MPQGPSSFHTAPGCFILPGVYPFDHSFNFTMEAPENAEVSLLIYEGKSGKIRTEIPISGNCRRGRVRSVLAEGLSPDIHTYNYLVDGKVVHDPLAHYITGRKEFGSAYPEDPHEIRCGLPRHSMFDWGEDCPPGIPYEEMILYKVHVRGYTKNAGGLVKKKGTFQGLTEMIPYWKRLGVNAVELMPAYEFPEVTAPLPKSGMVSKKEEPGRINFWGYIPGYYLAPKQAYCATDAPEDEVRNLVRELHRAGMECIMEFFFPKGINQVHALKALQFWHLYYRVDGFHVQGEGVSPEMILQDGILSGAKILVQGLDAQNQDVLCRNGRRLAAEYNPGFQEDMRRFLKSDEDMAEKAMWRIRRNPAGYGVVNYMASQDGFTLQDMVCYNFRHNEANGQENQDGSSYNYTWNCGTEGPTRKTAVRKIREKQIRNAVLLLMLSQGTPMIYGGDEFGNSQNGNNNAWCQDNPTGWVDWKAEKRNAAREEFVRRAIAFRKENPILHEKQELKGTDYKAFGFPDISFHGERAWYVNKDNTARMFGVMYHGGYAREDAGGKNGQPVKPSDFLYVAYNFHWEARSFALPNLPEGICWKKIADTAKDWEDCFGEEAVPCLKTVEVSPRTVVILQGKEAEE